MEKFSLTDDDIPIVAMAIDYWLQKRAGLHQDPWLLGEVKKLQERVEKRYNELEEQENTGDSP